MTINHKNQDLSEEERIECRVDLYFIVSFYSFEVSTIQDQKKINEELSIERFHS